MNATYDKHEILPLIDILTCELKKQQTIYENGWKEYKLYLIGKYNHGFTLANIFKWSDEKIVDEYDTYRSDLYQFTQGSATKSGNILSLIYSLEKAYASLASTVTLTDQELKLLGEGK